MPFSAEFLTSLYGQINFENLEIFREWLISVHLAEKLLRIGSKSRVEFPENHDLQQSF